MSTRTIRQLVDDLDGSDAEETITFAVNGAVYEIDLSEPHAKEFYEFMDRYMENGRKLPKNSIHTPGRKASSLNGYRPSATPATAAATQLPTSYTRLGKEQNKAIRDWAKKQKQFEGLPERGRIPREVVEAFNAAHA